MWQERISSRQIRNSSRRDCRIGMYRGTSLGPSKKPKSLGNIFSCTFSVSVINILNGFDILVASCPSFILKFEILVSYCYCRNLLSWFYFPSRKTNKWSVRSDELRKLYSKPKLPSRTFTSFIRVMGWDWSPCYCPFLLPSLTKKMKHWWKDNWQENTEMFGDKLHMCHFAYFSHKRNIPVLNSSLRREKPTNYRLHYIDSIRHQSTIQPINQPNKQPKRNKPAIIVKTEVEILNC